MIHTLMTVMPYALAAGMSATAPGTSMEVRPEEQQAWLRWVIPLPKEAAIPRMVKVAAADLSLVVPEAAGELARSGAGEIQALLKEATGAEVPVAATEPANGFAFCFERDEGILPAEGLRNREQAYTIRPGEEGRSLRLLAEGETGLYYAAKTLQRLLRSHLLPSSEIGTAQQAGGGGQPAVEIQIPLAEILDWPDLAERGQWGGNAPEDLEWMSERKMNLVEWHAHLSLDDEGHGHATMKLETLENAHRRAMQIVPIIHHLEQLVDTGIFERHPEFKAQGVPDSICFSQPGVAALLREWFVELGQLPHVREVMVWLSEEGRGCECEGCRPVNRFVAETRTLLAAWEQAKQTVPNLGLRILLTQASYDSNALVLAEIPEGVHVSYYHGGRTYDSSREVMIYPLLGEYVARGRWLGVYPQVTSCWRLVQPWCGPQFVRARMTEFVDKGLTNLVAYAVPSNRHHDYNVTAAAEWSWNAHGRDEHEFSLAWATRRGLRDPEKVAQWADLLGPVGWDVYGSRVMFYEAYGTYTSRLRNGPLGQLGEGMFLEFHRPEQFDEDLETCARALALAEEIGDPDLLAGTQAVTGYVQTLKWLYYLSQHLAGPTPPIPPGSGGERGGADGDRPALQEAITGLQTACLQTIKALEAWDHAIDPTGAQPDRLEDTINFSRNLATEIGAYAQELGFTSLRLPFPVQVGTWDTAEFNQAGTIDKRLDVTQQIEGSGVYRVTFRYKSGRLGLTAHRVALESAPANAPDDVRLEAEDVHSCHAGAWVKDHIYRLELKAYDPQRIYTLVARVSGGSPETPPEKRSTAGVIVIERDER